VDQSTPPVPPSTGDPSHHDQPPGAASPPEPAPKRPIQPWIVLGAGAAVIFGSFLPWASVTAPIVGTITASGVDGSDGWITAGLGLILVVYATLILRGQRIPNAVPILVVLAAVTVLGIGVWKVADLSAAEDRMREEMATATKDDVFGIARSMSNATQMKVGIGLWLIPLAGLAGSITTALMTLAHYRSKQKTL
jgi:hypothetical protein